MPWRRWCSSWGQHIPRLRRRQSPPAFTPIFAGSSKESLQKALTLHR
nr:MAG TPA: hypothetical protein [Caudoviricetes sp.]